MIFYSYYMCRWIYKTGTIEHTVVIFGTWTVTLKTGMALLKELYPEGKSNAPENIVVGSGIAAAAIGLMMILNLASMAEVIGNGIYYLWTFITLTVYAASMVLGIILVKRHYRRKSEGLYAWVF